MARNSSNQTRQDDNRPDILQGPILLPKQDSDINITGQIVLLKEATASSNAVSLKRGLWSAKHQSSIHSDGRNQGFHSASSGWSASHGGILAACDPQVKPSGLLVP